MQLSSFLILAASTASISLAKVVTSTKDNPVCGSDGHQSGYFADMSNCIKYYHCFEGDVQEHRTCGKSQEGDQLLYNVEKVECDYDRNVDCGARPICDTNNQNCHDQGDDPEPDDNRCQGKEDGYHPNMANCRKYLHCFEENVEEELLCPTEAGKQEVFDPDNVWCDFQERVKCGERPICDDDDKNCHDQDEGGDDDNDFCKDKDNGYYADPNNCIQYFHCYDGVLEEELTCPIADGKQELYDPVNTWCDYPERVDCGNRPICDVNDENCHDQDNGGNEDDDVCKDLPDGYHPDPENCVQYWHCFDGILEKEFTCPVANGKQELYSRVNKWCDYPDNVDCEGRPICDENDKNCHDQDDNGGDDDNVCQGHPDGVHADPTNCIKYFNCANGNGARITCPEAFGKQELFDEKHLYCDFPENVDCGNRPICDEEDKNCHN